MARRDPPRNPATDEAAASATAPQAVAARLLRPSAGRRLEPPVLLQELALRPEFLDGIVLGKLQPPEALRRPGQWVLRTQDLLSLHLELRNLQARAADNGGERGASPTLMPLARGQATITLHFPPQAIAERVFFAAAKTPTKEQDGHVEADTGRPPAPSASPTPLEELAPPPIASRLAHPSRLVFVWDEQRLRSAGCWPVPYTLAGVLQACRALQLKVAANARYQRPRLPGAVAVLTWRKPRLADLRKTYDRLSAQTRATVLASALRNERLARRLGPLAAVVLLRRAELPSAPEADQRLPLTPAALALGSAVSAIGLAQRPWVDFRTVPHPRRPAADETAVELPFRLQISPNAEARFTHDTRAAWSAPTGHTALWATRLAEAAEAGTGVHQALDEPIRAIWARGGPESDTKVFTDDWNTVPQPLAADTKPFKLFRQTLDDRDRYNIVHLSGNFALSGGRHEPVDCQRLMLSSLGGWLDARGAWQVPRGLAVEQWVHHAAQARDHYVRVVYKGYLLPFGHRVSLVKVSERFFQKNRPDNAAYLLQRMYLIVREPVRSFAETHLTHLVDGHNAYYHRGFPFPVVKLLTEVTPDLADPISTQVAGSGQAMFWPTLPGAADLQPYRFQYAAIDLDGNEIRFDLPAIFIDNMLANPAVGDGMANYVAARDDWRRTAPGNPARQALYRARRSAQLHRQKVALAPSGKPGDTASEVDTLEFDADTEGLAGQIASPLMRPVIASATVRLPAVGALTGGSGLSTLHHDAGFLAQASGYGAGEVYARLAAGGQALDFSRCGNRSGGFVQPSLAPSGLSRRKGPVSGDLAQVAAGQFKPTDFFGSLSPLLFGCIPLGELVQEIAGAAGFDEMPNFVTEALQQGEALFAQLGQLDRLDEVVIGLVQQAARSALQQAVAAAFAPVAQQLAVLDATTAALKAEATAVATAAAAVATTLGSAGAALLSSPAALSAAVKPLSDALASLGAALTARDTTLKAPGFGGLSAATAQVVRQALALVQQRVAQGQALLDDAQRIPALVDAAQQAWAKVQPVLVTPEALKALLDAGTLGPLLTALNGALGGFGSALTQLKLLDGAPKRSFLALVDTLGGVLGAVDKLLPVLESLLGDEIVVRFEFKPTLSAWPPASGHSLSALHPLFEPLDPKGFVVAVEARVKKSGGPPEAKVRCALTHFNLNLLGKGDSGFIELDFERIEFSADASLKTNVDVAFSGIHFIGVLSFVESLRDLIPLDGFSDPPGLTVDEHGIQASFSVALPNLAVGVMSLSNLSLGAGFTVPFIGQPLSVSFNFCKRDAPFNLTVSMFGGGGFFGITIDPHGVQVLEASFEFGASIAIDFGVASGGVHVMAGIYFRMEPSKASLTGYFRLGGNVDVLGLISASIELYLDLVYAFDEGKCVGHASLTIEVHLFFFSIGVSISCERKFAGSSGDPSFAALMGPDADVPIDDSTRYAWREYCEAFA